ncbi:hypothetical protein [Nocardia salmonicida]|nr:hypothetical protein [Nocardia salmonicida]
MRELEAANLPESEKACWRKACERALGVGGLRAQAIGPGRAHS